jgi:hypothetical protein
MQPIAEDVNLIAKEIVDAAFKIHKTLGRDLWNLRMKLVYLMR